jgi:hypothetical protein
MTWSGLGIGFRVMALALVLSFFSGPAEAAAQGRRSGRSLSLPEAGAPSLEAPEVLAIRASQHEVTGLYVASASLIGTAIVLGVIGGLTLSSGDSIGAGIVPLFSAPGIGTIGLVLLALAAGYDAGVARWDEAHARRRGEPALDGGVSERNELSTTIGWVYGIGFTTMLLCGGALVTIAAVEGFRSPLYLFPTVLGGVGLVTVLGAAGMDIAGGHWSGFGVSVAPVAEGAMGSLSGTF